MVLLLWLYATMRGIMIYKSCSFFGHRKLELTEDEKTELKIELYIILENLIKQGCEFFFFGGFGEFDEVCWQIATNLKQKFPDIKRIYCLADENHLRPTKRPKYLKQEDYEEFVYFPLEYNYWYSRIYYRNCAMIDQSDIVIFYVEKRKESGAYKALEYALRKKKEIINLI